MGELVDLRRHRQAKALILRLVDEAVREFAQAGELPVLDDAAARRDLATVITAECLEHYGALFD